MLALIYENDGDTVLYPSNVIFYTYIVRTVRVRQEDSIVPQFSNVMKQLFNPHNFLPKACGLEELPTSCPIKIIRCIVNFKF